jgi:hypothetical protein
VIFIGLFLISAGLDQVANPRLRAFQHKLTPMPNPS